jgi:hypothetical protein
MLSREPSVDFVDRHTAVTEARESDDWMNAQPRRFRTLVLALTLLLLAVLGAAPTAAIVVFEPTREPAPERWTADVLVSVEWADVSMRIPGSWDANVKRAPLEGAGGASLLVAFGPGDSMCLLDRYDSASVESWQDVGVSAAAELTIAGYPVERFDDMLGTGAPIASAYSIDAGARVYSLMCSADQAPGDRWLSIAETIVLP